MVMKCPVCRNDMTQLLISWVCDHCPQELEPLNARTLSSPPKEDLWAVGSSFKMVSTGFTSLDDLTGGGYPVGRLSEVFGDRDTLRRVWDQFSSWLIVDLDRELSPQLEVLQDSTCSFNGNKKIAVRMVGGDGRKYANFTLGAAQLVRGCDCALVFFNEHARNNPFRSTGPQVLNFSASVRVRVMDGVAQLIKSTVVIPPGGHCAL